jgi:hypothetical protein
VRVYGRTIRLRVKVFDALWYSVGRGQLIRFVVVRGRPGHKDDDVLCTTDVSLKAEQVMEIYCPRWPLEVTFHETKGRLGFEDPQNRTERAVEHTAPMALVTYTLVVAWYLTVGHRLPTARLLQLPWYTKTLTAFSDMLATLRRETWRHRLSSSSTNPRAHPKSFNTCFRRSDTPHKCSSRGQAPALTSPGAGVRRASCAGRHSSWQQAPSKRGRGLAQPFAACSRSDRCWRSRMSSSSGIERVSCMVRSFTSGQVMHLLPWKACSLAFRRRRPRWGTSTITACAWRLAANDSCLRPW